MTMRNAFADLATDAALEELQAIEQRLKVVMAQLQRLSFDNTSQIRVVVSSLPTLSTLSTLSTMTTGNIGLGDCGKAATAILTSQQQFACGVGQNFIRS